MRKLWLFAFSFLVFCSLLQVLISGVVDAEDDETIEVWLEVGILDIDHYQKTALIEVYVYVFNYPYNLTDAEVFLGGGGYVTILCPNTYAASASTIPKFAYEGKSNVTTWNLNGWSETYPFDYYLLSFSLDDITLAQNNFSIDPHYTYAVFIGSKANSLNELWHLDHGMKIPIHQLAEKEVSFIIQRSSNVMWKEVVQFLVPIVSCYYLLGATSFLKKEHLVEKLSIHLSLIIFSSVFLISIPNVPYNLSLLETLISILIVSTVIFGIFSIMSNLYNKSIRMWNLGPSMVSLIVFTTFYTITFAGKLDPLIFSILLLVIVPAYIYGYIIKNYVNNVSIKVRRDISGDIP